MFPAIQTKIFRWYLINHFLNLQGEKGNIYWINEKHRTKNVLVIDLHQCFHTMESYLFSKSTKYTNNVWVAFSKLTLPQYFISNNKMVRCFLTVKHRFSLVKKSWRIFYFESVYPNGFLGIETSRLESSKMIYDLVLFDTYFIAGRRYLIISEKGTILH